MKVVIDIDEEDYKKATDHLRMFNEKALNEPFMNATLRDRVDIALLRGTPLPKNHGRLIDADVLVEGMEDNYELCMEVNATPTIIPSEREEEE